MEKRISSVAFPGIRNPCRSEGLPRGTRNEFSSRAVFGNVFQLFAEGEVNIGNIPRDEVKGMFTNIHEPEANNCFSIINQVIIENNLPLLIKGGPDFHCRVIFTSVRT